MRRAADWIYSMSFRRRPWHSGALLRGVDVFLALSMKLPYFTVPMHPTVDDSTSSETVLEPY